jgi:hypothetical protein
MTTAKTKTRRATREKSAKPDASPSLADQIIRDQQDQLRAYETDQRNTRSLLQSARSEIAILRRDLAEAREQAERPWWRRIFDWMAP